MIVRFERASGLVVVRARVAGPEGERSVRLAVDTGASFTLLSPAVLSSVGAHPLAGRGLRIATVSGLVAASISELSWLGCLGHRRDDFPVLIHAPPPGARIDGLLGLDFLRGRRLTIDFGAGTIELV